MEQKSQLDASRSVLIGRKGFDSLEYIKQLVADNERVMDLQGDAIEEVTKLVNVADYILESSQDAYIGDMEKNITTASIQKLLDLFVYHPIQSNIDKTQEEAQEIVDDILSKAVARITNQDTEGLFEQPVEYLQCFNQLCCDIARESHNMTEADYQFLMDQYDLI